MTMKPHFKMMAAYNRWANERIYHAVSELDDEAFSRDLRLAFGSICGTLNHLIVTDRIWMKRFTNTGESYASLDTLLFTEFGPLRAARKCRGWSGSWAGSTAWPRQTSRGASPT